MKTNNEFKPGTLVKVIDGGKGCQIANGVIGNIVTRLEILDNNTNYPNLPYSGEFLFPAENGHPEIDVDQIIYIKSISSGHYYGLCKGYEIEKQSTAWSKRDKIVLACVVLILGTIAALCVIGLIDAL